MSVWERKVGFEILGFCGGFLMIYPLCFVCVVCVVFVV